MGRGFVPAYPRHQLANPTSSEAGALQALLRVAVEAPREDALAAGYAEMATAFGGDVERTEHRAAHDRYAARTDASI